MRHSWQAQIVYSAWDGSLCRILYPPGDAVKASQLASSVSVVNLQVLVQDSQGDERQQQVGLR